MALSDIIQPFQWGAGGARLTPEEIAKRREMEDALLARGVDTSPVGHWTQGLARVADALAGSVRRGRLDKSASANATENQQMIANLLSGGGQQFPGAPVASGGSSVPSDSDYATTRVRSAASGLEPEQIALLNTISGPESAGKYNVIYGGKTFSDYSDHPRIAVPIASGPNTGKTSSAAGKYQFLGSTWDAYKNKLGLPDFSPESQDRAAWALASDVYRQKTGQDLAAVLKSGDPQAIAGIGQTLSGTWTSLPGGIEQGTNTDRFVTAYQRALGASPAIAAVNAMARGTPTQVASLDPSIASDLVQRGPMPSAQDTVTPIPNTPAAASGISTEGALTPLDAPRMIEDRPIVGEPVQRVAQSAEDDLSRIPVTAGGNAGVSQPGGGGINPAIMQALSSPYANDQVRSIAGILMQQQMQQNDPMRALERQKTQLEIDQLRNPRPKYDFITGKDGSIFRSDNQGNINQVYGGKPDQPNDVREYEYAKGQGYTGTFQDFQLEQKRAGASQVNIDQKAEGQFEKTMAEGQAKAFNTMAEEGLNARAELGVINELDTLLKGQGGTMSGVAGALAKYGIGGEGMDDIQAAQALINKLVPSQRQPGSGSMSDRDVELFSRSLPSLWNTPGGNQKIINVMRGLAQYKQQQGEIADQVMTGEISRQEARRALRALPNPLEGFKPSDMPKSQTPKKQTVIKGYTIEEVE